ncbi:MAG: DUF2235 domain-containing protein [Myxococcales bacterium]|nr:DUF2235 domain-containing protein [Myxococcales bacterium]
MSERDVAEDQHAAAGGFSSRPPGACRTCQMPRKLRAGVFFDGTNNNKSRDQPTGNHTNVVRLYDVYPQAGGETLYRKYYIRGVGSQDQGERARQLGQEIRPNSWNPLRIAGSVVAAPVRLGGYVADLGQDLAGKVGGAGGTARLNLAYTWLSARCGEVQPQGERTVDIFGFSRGAAIARTFTNLVNQGLQRQQPLIRVRFLGIFDTVGSFGIPGDDSDPGENLGIDTLDAREIAHYTARHEYRQNFPLTRTSSSDTPYTGCHSDVGGSYPPVDSENRVNHLAAITFLDMYDALRRHEPALAAVTAAMSCGLSRAQVAALKRRAAAEAPAEAQMAGQERRWTAAQRAFWERYIHQSHTSPSDWWIVNQAKRLNPNHLDNSGRRRLFPNPPRQELRGTPPNFSWRRP